MNKLTAEQQKLVEDNHNLIYLMIHKTNLDLNDHTDWYGICALALCKAATQYNEIKGCKFSTFACICIKNEILMEMRHQKRYFPSNIISLNTPIFNDDSEELINQIVDNQSDKYVNNVEFMELFNKALNKMSENHKAIIVELIETPLSRQEIADLHNTSKQNISVICHKFKKLLYKEINN